MGKKIKMTALEKETVELLSDIIRGVKAGTISMSKLTTNNTKEFNRLGRFGIAIDDEQVTEIKLRFNAVLPEEI